MTGAKAMDAARLLILPFLLGIIWVFAVPSPIAGAGCDFQPDEISHALVARYYAHFLSPPPLERPYETTLHPPLYHACAGLIWRGAEPLFGETGAVRFVRFCGVLMGLGTVWFAYRAARQTRLARAVATRAALLVALVPMRVSLSAAITNENLAALASAASLALLFEGLRFGFPPRRYAWLCFWCILAIGSKITCAGLLPCVGVALLHDRYRRGQGFAVPVARFAALLAGIGAAWGWWLVQNTLRYGDPVRKKASDILLDPVQPGYAVIGVERGFAPWRYLLALLHIGWMSFWGFFAAMTRPLPPAVYNAILLFQIVTLAGAAIGGFRTVRRYQTERAIAAITALFAAWVLLVYCQFNWAHFTPQGRYFFVLLAPFGILSAGGLQVIMNASRLSIDAKTAVWYAVIILLLCLNLFVLTLPRC